MQLTADLELAQLCVFGNTAVDGPSELCRDLTEPL